MKTQACLNDNHDFYGPGGGSRRLLKVFPNSVVRDNARISQQKMRILLHGALVPGVPLKLPDLPRQLPGHLFEDLGTA